MEPASLSIWRPYSPIVSDLPCHWVLSMYGDVGWRGATSSHVKNLTAQTWRSTRGWSFSSLTQPHWPLRTPRSSRCRLQVYRCVCVFDCTFPPNSRICLARDQKVKLVGSLDIRHLSCEEPCLTPHIAAINGDIPDILWLSIAHGHVYKVTKNGWSMAESASTTEGQTL